MATEVYNPSVEITALPGPLTGILKGGQRIVLSYTPAALEAAVPSIGAALRIRDLGDSYPGSTDDASFGLASGQTVAQSITVNDATANDITAGMTLSHTTSGTASAGIGAGFVLKAENGAGTAKRAALIAGSLTDVTDTAEVGLVGLYPAVADVPVAGARVQGVASAVNGVVVLPSATTAAVRVYPYGSDTNVSIRYLPKGTTGQVALVGGSNALVGIAVNDTGVGFFGTAPAAQGAALSDIGAFTDPPSAAEMAALRTAVNGILARLRTPGFIAT